MGYLFVKYLHISAILAALIFNNALASRVTRQVTEKGPTKVHGQLNEVQAVNFREGQLQQLTCEAEGTPASGYTWEGPGGVSIKDLDLRIKRGELEDGTSTSDLIFSNPIEAVHAGSYKCTANSKNGKVQKVFHVEFKEQSGSGAIIGGISVTIVVVTLIVVWLLMEFFRSARNGLTKEEIKEFLYGNPDSEIGRRGEFAHESATYMPYNMDFEVHEHRLYIDKRSLLGEGAYGQVLRGKFNKNTVAVKTLKHGADKLYLKALLTELKIMIYLGKHSNVVNLIGACSKHLRNGQLYIIVEFCELGNMEKYLRDRKFNYINQFSPDGSMFPLSSFTGYEKFKSNQTKYLCTEDLLNWCHQVAKGMKFLGSKKVIHGDLATRNILLSDRNTVKINDFGLSRQLYDYSNYVKRNQEPLPWRWLALESLKELAFSCQSDIWSYGVTVWEIFSLGDVPYPGLTWNADFVSQLENNMRLIKPTYATDEMYEVLTECWRGPPEERMPFEDLEAYFYNLLITCQLKNKTKELGKLGLAQTVF